MTDTTVATLARIQVEQVPWQQHNFPARTEWQCLLGVAEEYFEAQEALGDIATYLDGIADHSIFLIDLCTALGISAPVALQIGRDIADFSGRPWPRYVGKLIHHFLKLAQGIRGDAPYHHVAMKNAIGCLFATLEHDCGLLGYSYTEVVAKTWDEEVKPRDWVAYPETGRPSAEPYEPPKLIGLCGPHPELDAVCILPKGHEGDHAWTMRGAS